MTIEQQLNNLLVFIKDNRKVYLKDLKTNPDFSGYELIKLTKHLIKDNYIIQHWPPGRGKGESWFIIRVEGELFINSGGYLRSSQENSLPNQLPIYNTTQTSQNSLSKKGWNILIWVFNHIWQIIMIVIGGYFLYILGWN